MLWLPSPVRFSPAGNVVTGRSRRASHTRVMHPYELHPARSWRSVNVMIYARRGEGKSLSMVWWGRNMRRVLSKVGWKIISNIQIRFADLTDPDLFGLLNDDPFIARKSLILWDEITETVPSARAMGNVSLGVATLVRQIRKLEAEFISTTQFPWEVDNRLKRQTEIYILCEGHIPRDAGYNPASARKAFVVLYLFDVFGNFYDNGAWASQNFPPPRAMADDVYILRDLDHVWADYDTGEFVSSSYGSAHAKHQVQKQWNQEALIAQRMRLADDRERDEPSYEQKLFDSYDKAKWAEAQALGVEIPTTVISAKPKTLAEWAESKAFNGPFQISSGTVQEARSYVDVKTVTELCGKLDEIGYDVARDGYRRYAERRR